MADAVTGPEEPQSASRDSTKPADALQFMLPANPMKARDIVGEQLRALAVEKGTQLAMEDVRTSQEVCTCTMYRARVTLCVRLDRSSLSVWAVQCIWSRVVVGRGCVL